MLNVGQSTVNRRVKNVKILKTSELTFPHFHLFSFSIQSKVKKIRKKLRTKPKHDQEWNMNQSNANKNSGLSADSNFHFK